ncbi:MAG: trigger factor, partial [Cyanobacteria bacterium J06627_15]
ADATKSNTEKALLDALAEQIEAEIPKTLVQREVDHLVTQTVMQFANQGIDVNQFLTKELVQSMRENSRGEAIERLKRTLALGEVAKKESLSVEDGAVQAKIQEIMDDVDDPASIDQERLQQAVHEDLLKEKILGWLSEKATVELVPEGTLTADSEAEAGSPEAEPPVSAADEVIEVEAVEAAATEEE